MTHTYANYLQYSTAMYVQQVGSQSKSEGGWHNIGPNPQHYS